MNDAQKWTVGLLAAVGTLGVGYQFIGGSDNDPTTIEGNRVLLAPYYFDGIRVDNDPIVFQGYEFDRYDKRRAIPIMRIKEKEGYSTDYQYMQGPDDWEPQDHLKFEVASYPQQHTDQYGYKKTVSAKLVGITKRGYVVEPDGTTRLETTEEVRRRMWGDDVYERHWGAIEASKEALLKSND